MACALAELPSCTAFAELGLDPEAQDADVAWVGTPPRLLVLARYSGHSRVHLVDPFGPRTISELRLEAPMKLYASVGTHALVIGTLGAAILSAGDKGITPHQFPARARPVTAGAAGTMFVVALAGAIEEWDPQNRMPKRRLKLPRPAVIDHVGGSDRVVWMITHDAPSRIEVIPLVNRGQPKAHELPEPIESIASHPRSDLVACVGATSGRIWVVDLDGRHGLRMIGAEGIERAEAVSLVFGRATGVLVAQTARPIQVVAVEREREAPVEIPTEVNSSIGPVPPQHGSKPNVVPVDDANAAEVRQKKPSSPPLDAAAQVHPDVPNVHHLGAWRERVQTSRARTSEPMLGLWSDALPAWREEAAAWARANVAVSADPSTGNFAAIGEAPASTPFGAIIARHELSPELQPVIALLYGAHLAGHDGVAPADIARLLGGRWDDALGRGELAASGVANTFGSRVRLSDPVLRSLDELPPSTGVLVGTPGQVPLLGPCVIVSASPLGIIAEACLASIGGAILASHSNVDPLDLAAEARAYGAAPMWRVYTYALDRIPPDQPIILVVDDDATADGLGIPRLT